MHALFGVPASPTQPQDSVFEIISTVRQDSNLRKEPFLERATGLEPATLTWKDSMLPFTLNPH